MDRLCEKGYVAKSALPSGPQIFRESHKGVEQTGAPKCWANAPTKYIAADMISISSLGWKLNEYIIPTQREWTDYLKRLSSDAALPKTAGRFVLRIKPAETGSSLPPEAHVHYWLAELRPADQLVKRVETVVAHLKESKFFSELIELGLCCASVGNAGLRFELTPICL
jgi:hypothetical protein